jgi:transposase-like protein
VPEDDAVARDSRKQEAREARSTFDGDTIERVMRDRVREAIEAIVEEELEAALGAASSARVGEDRRGYRHGTRSRTLTTSLGPATIAMPRARLVSKGATREWRSRVVPRYQRRTERVDEAILGLYLAVANTRRVKSALSPLLTGAPLSKDAVSRLIGRMSEDLESWRTRQLGDEDIVYLFLDGWYPKVRIGKRRERVPVLVTLGVRSDGEKVVLDMRIAGDESAAAWGEVIADLVKRKLRAPVLAVIDGSPGMPEALCRHWPKIAIQRCTVHKLRNLEAKAPVSLREELSEDYRRMIYGKTATEVEKARAAFVKKWKLRCPAVERSLREAGDDLFTFLRFPTSQWKALRTTNALERINEEFRRRTKTQASLPNEASVLLLLFGLLRSGKIKMRKINGWEELPKRPTKREEAA